MLGFAVLCNGGGYANRPPKFIAMSALLPVALALLMLNHVRYAAPYGYALSCAKFTTPIVALAGGMKGWGWGGGGGEDRERQHQPCGTLRCLPSGSFLV
jgi:hypothetical protein